MRLYERYRPRTLQDILGQRQVIGPLSTFALEPYPSILILEGESGTGKTATAMILADMLGDHGWFGSSVYRLNGADLSIEAARRYFDGTADSPFRFRVGDNKFHVLKIEELEWVSPQCQRYLKDALEESQRRWRVVVIATSNNASKLEKALRHRFQPFSFSAGPTFANAINDWLPEVWETEMGKGVEMPYGWDSLGWEKDAFSARLALDRLETYIAIERTAQREEIAA